MTNISLPHVMSNNPDFESEVRHMTIREIITDYLDRERNNVFCYADNWLMNSPKRGYEREFCEAQERAELLEELLRQLA